MARLENKHLKVFAQDAINNGVFGSAADNTKVLSNDVETIQSKPAWLTGWLDAVIGARKFPTLEEFQSCNYVNTYMISYLRQEGVAEWNANTTYYQNSIVKRTGTYEIYGSLTDNNTGNPVTDTNNWLFLQDLSQSTVPDATTVLKGIAMLATVADVIAGNTDKIVTPDLLAQYGFQTGDVKATTSPTLQSGWVWAAGTVGNASSGATRANADTEQLFRMYWNATAYNYTGTTATGAALQVYNSSGNPVAKGVSATADWNNNRRISVVDLRDRVLAGRGNMVGNAGRLSGQTGGVNGNGLGNSGGLESETLSINQIPSHSHSSGTLATASAGNHSHAFATHFPNNPNGSSPAAGHAGTPLGTASTNLAGAHTHAITGNTANNGGGALHNNVQPTIICNYVIKL